MTWIHDFVDGLFEVRDLREAVVIAARAKDKAETEAKTLRAERDKYQTALEAVAAANVRLAHAAELAELRAAQWRARWQETT